MWLVTDSRFFTCVRIIRLSEPTNFFSCPLQISQIDPTNTQQEKTNLLIVLQRFSCTDWTTGVLWLIMICYRPRIIPEFLPSLYWFCCYLVCLFRLPGLMICSVSEDPMGALWLIMICYRPRIIPEFLPSLYWFCCYLVCLFRLPGLMICSVSEDPMGALWLT